ncbi:hypothetical protein SDC9_114749 [bioreactor metagenome]|uniref:Uncharacterized protein n=1 Tax=bioreactor metagenome TaxID=1076179 RepID=A0A645C1I1_9ZZZZ
MHRLIVEVGVHIFLNQVSHDIDVVVELTHAGIIPLRDRNLLHLVFEIVAKV